MPQMWLPIIPSGSSKINDVLSVVKKKDSWFYFCGLYPVFFHAERDRRSFRMFTAQLVCQGICKQAEIVRAFGVSKNSVSRSVQKYRISGADAFFTHRKGHGGSVLTEEVKTHAQELLNLGESRQDVAKKLNIKYDTFRKAINRGRLSEPPVTNKIKASDKSTRSFKDASAEMGNACTRPLERISAALGFKSGCTSIRFEACHDVSLGGVLCALPALVASGLFSHVDKCFKTLNGYYTTLQIIILIAQMALCRIKTVEQLQYQSPGEMGKLMGLDRIPEVRCLRNKLSELSKDNAPEKWSRLLSQDWMESSPELAGALYVDGHVRVYHGEKTRLPKRFVSRQRLCLRGTTDYWINDALGQPYFVINRPVDQGMLEALRTDIVPRLLKDVPKQPSDEELQGDPHRYRFVMIFDREGYSPVFFKEMWEKHRIACITYHKFPKEIWPLEWFKETEIKMPSGETLTMKLAEMGSWIGDKKNGLWVREVRKLSKNKHQTSLISSAKNATAKRDAALIFSRWSQENFFGYMAKHYAIDLLSEYGTEGFTGKQQVVNPIWRELDRQSRSLKSKLTNRRASFAALELHPELDNKAVSKWKHRKAGLVEEIEHIEHELDQLKDKIAENPKHLDWHELKDEDKFQQLSPSRKHLTDTIKMIAYRAETAMMNIVREKLSRKDDARALICDLCKSEADILPDIKAGVLNIQIHTMANQRSNQAIEHLLNQLNDAAFNYPATKLKMKFRMITPATS
jgi:predicted  nucleic acid-binding Zn-ribbon protein